MFGRRPSRTTVGPPSSLSELPLRERVWRVVFRSDTKAGRAFDLTLLVIIALSVMVVVLESVASLRAQWGRAFFVAEGVFTAIFTVEYLVRLAVVRDRARYATSFFGVIDLLTVMPTFLELVFPGSHYLMVIRVFRLLRMFRVLKMAQHVGEANVILNALMASRRKIAVFMLSVLAVIFVEGSVMYVVESPSNPGFASIPHSVYWAVVTLTTVGYGDVSPVTVFGKVIASGIMLTGFAIIAVPTGVVTAEVHRELSGREIKVPCPQCGHNRHEPAARYCSRCGSGLPLA